jgi:hypothetical protein
MPNPALGVSNLQTNGGGASLPWTTSGVTTQATGSSFVIIFVGSNGTPTYSDSYSNTYTPLYGNVGLRVPTGSYMYAAYCLNGNGGNTHTATVGNALLLGTDLIFIEITNSNALNAYNQFQQTSGLTTPCAVTTTVINTLCLSFIANTTSAVNNCSFSSTNSWTLATGSNGTGTGYYQACQLASIQEAAIGTYDPGWLTANDTNPSTAFTLAFSGTGGGGGGGGILLGQICT